jgi:outer membrane receptor protein involved in Fe transport
VARRFHRLAAYPSLLWLVVLMLVVIWLSLPARAPAQVSTATVNGTVHDSSGAIIPGATVVLHNVDQNVDRTVTTNEVGYYVIENIIPGSYNISVSKTGFTTAKQSDITLVVNQTATFDMTLSPGVVSEVVNVAAQAAALEASTAELGVAIVKTEVNDLPLNGRNFTQLLNLTPGVSTIDVSQNASGAGGIWSTPIGTFNYPSVNGQTNRSDLFFLDGLNDEGSFGSTYVVAPIVDDIQEFKVQSHNDDPSYGGSLGGIVNAVTKSGTNAFHGSAWEFARNTSFDARNTFVANRIPFQQNQFGGAIGGPVVLPGYNGHNKTFFFASYEGYRNHTTATNFYNTPTSTQLTGDLSGISGQIYNPYPLVSGLPSLTQPFTCDASGNPVSPNPDGSQTGGTPCNKIPSSLLDQNAVKYASTLYPAPNHTPTQTSPYNGLDLTKSITRQDEGNLRLDHNFSEKSSAWARYTGYSQPSSGSGGFIGLVHNIYSHGYNAGGGFTHTFGGSAVLDLMFGRDSANINQFTHYASNPTPSQFGFAPNFYSEFQGGASMVPNIVLSGYLGNTNTSAHNATQYDETHLSDVWEWKGDFTKNYQHHTFRMGADFVSNNADALYLNSSETYGPGPTALTGNTAGTGNSLASFLLGSPTSYSRRNTRETQHGGWVDGFYFTDQWKATSKLTANLGVRFDVTLIPIYGNNPNVDYYVGDLDGDTGQYILARMPPSCAVTNAAPCLPTGSLPANVILTPLSGGAIYHTDKSNWQPRIGLAYQLRPSTVLRASYGRFFDNWGAITQTAQNYEGTWPGFGQLGGGNLNIPGGHVGSYENPANLAGTSPLPPPTPFGNETWYADPFLKRPLSDQWNFGIQEALGKGTVLTVNYVGSHDGRLDLGMWTNTATTPNAAGFQNGARSPFPYITPTDFDKSIGRSSYNALQATLNGKLSTNLTYLISYTWSKSIDIGCSGWYGVEGCSIQNFYNLNADKGPSAFDLPQIFSLSWVYQLPFGHGQRWSTGNKGLDYVVGNWQFNGIATFTSGIPYTVGVGGEDDIAGTGGTEYNSFGSGSGGYERMDIVGSPKLSSPTRAEWFSTSAFAAPAAGTFGNVGRDTLRSDPYKNFDLSLFRQFPITEDKKLEFRFEMFNAFNQVVYNTPDAAYADGPLFGTVGSTANVARQMQFALKLYF